MGHIMNKIQSGLYLMSLGDTCMRHWTGASLFGANPSSEPTMIYNTFDPQEQN